MPAAFFVLFARRARSVGRDAPVISGWDPSHVLDCAMQQEVDLTRLIADLQARSVIHHHIIMQLVKREAHASGDVREYLSILTDQLTMITDKSIPLDDTRAAAMSMREYLDDFLVRAGAA